MTHRLNTNKQFMVGNAILFIALIFVVFLFLYLSLRLQQKKEGERHYAETYTLCLEQGFAGQAVSVMLNDSTLFEGPIASEPCTLRVTRFADQNALMIVDGQTDRLSLFELAEEGGTYRFAKRGDKVELLTED